jgi:hypothetical protein
LIFDTNIVVVRNPSFLVNTHRLLAFDLPNLDLLATIGISIPLTKSWEGQTPAEPPNLSTMTDADERNAIKRVYIGGLLKNAKTSNLLQVELRQWIQQQVPTVEIASLEINNGGGRSAPHALLDCGTHANTIIRTLHQQDFQGRRLTVQREKRGGGGKPKPSTTTTATANGKHMLKPSTFGQRGWSKPKQQQQKPQIIPFHPIPVKEATKQIQSVMFSEMALAEEKGEDPFNVALASTAAVTFLASMNAFSTEETPADILEEEHIDEDEDGDYGVAEQDPGSFQLKDMSELLADFGTADPEWMKLEIVQEPTTTSTKPPGWTNNQLARHGKAPIHILFSSFGYIHGAPKRPEGWSPVQPLAPIDCRQFAPIPYYLDWHHGLSAAGKRAMQQHSILKEDDGTTTYLRTFARTTVAKQLFDCLLEAQNERGVGYASPLEMTIYVGSETGRHRSVVVAEWAATQVRKFLGANDNDCIQQPVSVGTHHRDINQKSREKQKRKKKKEEDDDDEEFGEGRKLS